MAEGEQKLDFDDLMVQCKRLFLERPEVLRAWQQKFQYILIDEFQDISPVQYEIVRMLALPENNLFIVGDDDQSIYQFRGAKPEIMLNFPKDYPGAAQVVLDKNYRSTEFIVKRSQCLIHHNKSGMKRRFPPTTRKALRLQSGDIRTRARRCVPLPRSCGRRRKTAVHMKRWRFCSARILAAGQQ